MGFINKNDLRKAVLKERMALSGAEITKRSLFIAHKVFEIEELVHADTILIYADFRNEVETSAIIKGFMEMGKRLAVPITVPDRRLIVPSRLLDYPGDLQPGRWGIPEPKPGLLRPVQPEEIDAVLVPGVAFDQSGNRLGYGGGYYDRFLSRLDSRAVFVALAFELQIRRNIDPDINDVPVHYIVTEERLIATGTKKN